MRSEQSLSKSTAPASPSTRVVTVRLDEAMISRLDRCARSASLSLTKASRASVARVALACGLPAVERALAVAGSVEVQPGEGAPEAPDSSSTTTTAAPVEPDAQPAALTPQQVMARGLGA
jgi:hypothetical protein